MSRTISVSSIKKPEAAETTVRRRRSKKAVPERNTTIDNDDDSINEIINQVANYNEAVNPINYEGRVPDLPTFEHLRSLCNAKIAIYRGFCERNKLLPIYYLTLISPILLALLIFTSSGDVDNTQVLNQFYEKNAKNNTDEYNDLSFFPDDPTNNRDIVAVMKKLNLNFMKLDKQVKTVQSADEINHMTRQIIQENIQIYEKLHETKYNNEKAAVNQKLALMNKKIQELEADVQALIKSNPEKKSGQEMPKSDFTNMLFQTELANFNQHFTESTKLSFQNKIAHDLKFWVENNFVSKSEFSSKYNGTKFSIWNYMPFGNQGVGASDFDRIKEFIKQTLYAYNADKTGMVDFALESAGASVITSRCSKSYNKNFPKATLFGFITLPYNHNSPRLTIQPQVLPGECWAMVGSKGNLVIRLSAKITPTSISIEHIPLVLVPNGRIDSAIRDFSVYGYKDETSLTGIPLGRYKYEADSPEYLQFFPVHLEASIVIRIVEVKVENNHGNVDYTCIYRVRVHGILAE